MTEGEKKHLCLWYWHIYICVCVCIYIYVYISTTALYRRFYTDKTHLCHCLSVLVRAVKCAHLKLLQQAVRATSVHFTAASPTSPLESLSHRRHFPTGTVILDTKERKKQAGGTLKHTRVCAASSSQWCADKRRAPLSSQHLASGLQFRRFSVFLALPFFPQKRIQSGLTFGL